MSTALSREMILSADDLPRRKVDVPEWGGYLHVRTLMGVERDAFEATVVIDGTKNLHNLRARLVARTACDADGLRLFTDEQAAELGQKSAAALDRVFTAATDLSKITEKDVEVLEKNS